MKRAIQGVFLAIAIAWAGAVSAASGWYTDHGCGDCPMDQLPCGYDPGPEHGIEHQDCYAVDDADSACYTQLNGPAGYSAEWRTAICSESPHGAIKCGNGTNYPGQWVWGNAANSSGQSVRQYGSRIRFENNGGLQKECGCLDSASTLAAQGCGVVSVSQLPACLRR